VDGDRKNAGLRGLLIERLDRPRGGCVGDARDAE